MTQLNTITKAELEKRYKNEKNLPLCKSLGISHGTLVSMLNRAGIPLKGRGNKNGSVHKYEIK